MRHALLTIDDSPTPRTPAVLRALLDRGAHAVFFCVGERLTAHPAHAAAILEAGFEIGNHGRTHRAFSSLSLAECLEEIDLTEEAIEAVHAAAGVPRRRRLFRFPYGDKGGEARERIQDALAARGFEGLGELDIRHSWYREHGLDADRDVFWTLDTRDYLLADPSSGFTFQDLLERLRDPAPVTGGSLVEGAGDEIVLAHDNPVSDSVVPRRFERLLEAIDGTGIHLLGTSRARGTPAAQ